MDPGQERTGVPKRARSQDIMEAEVADPRSSRTNPGHSGQDSRKVSGQMHTEYNQSPQQQPLPYPGCDPTQSNTTRLKHARTQHLITLAWPRREYRMLVSLDLP